MLIDGHRRNYCASFSQTPKRHCRLGRHPIFLVMPPPKVIGPHAPPAPPGEIPRPEGAEPLVTVRAWHWPCRHTGSSGRFEHSRLLRQAKLTHSPGKNKKPFEQVPVPPQSAVLVQLWARAWHIIKTERTKPTLAIRSCRTIDVIARNSRVHSSMVPGVGKIH